MEVIVCCGCVHVWERGTVGVSEIGAEEEEEEKKEEE
jgi:hypothetical protein